MTICSFIDGENGRTTNGFSYISKLGNIYQVAVNLNIDVSTELSIL